MLDRITSVWSALEIEDYCVLAKTKRLALQFLDLGGIIAVVQACSNWILTHWILKHRKLPTGVISVRMTK
jgi:hypothetical protein